MALVLGMNCPHCRKRAQVRTSNEITLTMREVYFLCTNIVCGHSWVAVIEATRTISPSGIPNPKVNLPVLERESIARIHDMLSNKDQRSIFDD